MICRGEDRPTVYILGAGATRGAIRHVLVNRKRLKPPLNGDFFRVAKTYVSAQPTSDIHTRYTKLRAALKTDFRLKGDPQMEESFSLLYVSKDFPGVFGTGRGRRPRRGTRREIADFLRITFGMLSALDQQGDPDHSLYDAMANSIGPADTIITLNYDTTLDSALVRAGWDPRVGYGLMGSHKKIKWRPDPTHMSRELYGVKLLKLHGSLNWWVRGSYSRLSGVFDKKPAKVTRPRRQEVSDHIRQIVPPIFGKFFGHAHWGNLWLQAFEALCEAEVVVVVGCSLVNSDFHLRALVERVATVRKAAGSPFRRGIFVDCAKIRRRWQSAFRGSIGVTEGYPNFAAFSRAYFRGRGYAKSD